MATAAVTPALPPGFQLDPPPPPGFELDAPAAPRAGLQPPGRQYGEIPTGMPPLAPRIPSVQERAASRMAAENPVTEKVLGAVEGALDLVAKLGGGIIGGLGGAYSAPFRGQSMEQGFAEGGAAGVGVAQQGLGLLGLGSGAGPRTETGQAIAEGTDRLLQNLPAAGGVYGTVAGPAMNARAAVRQVAAPVTQVARQGLDVAGSMVDRGAAAVQGLRRREPAPTAGTPGSAGAAGVDMATQRRERARGLPVPFEGDAALTEGQATRSFEAQRFEKETAKDPDLGGKLRERAAEQNAVVQRNLDAIEAFTGAQKAERGAAGQVVVDAIAAKAKRAKAEIDQAYTEARDAGDMAEPIDATPLAQWIEDNRSSAGNAGVIGTAEAELQRLGGAQKAGDGSLVPREITINDLEELRKKIVAGGKKDPTNAHFAAEINRVIDAATNGKGGDLYKAARAKFRGYQAEFKERGAIRDLIGIKKGTSDQITATEKVLERAMRSTDDLKNVRETLITAGDEGTQAWREVQGLAMRKLRDDVTRGVSPDIRGNPIVSPAKLKQTIDKWDQDGQLEVLFGKQGAQTLRDLRDVSQDVFTAPAGSVNPSGTASVLGAEVAKWAADVSAMALVTSGAMPLPLISLAKAIKRAREGRKVKKQIDRALGPKEPPAPKTTPPRNPLEGSDKLPPKDPAPAPAPRGTSAAAPAARNVPADNPLLAEIEAMKQGASPEVVRVLEAEAMRVQREARTQQVLRQRAEAAQALEQAARQATNPTIQRALQARANELRAEKIPAGEATELPPETGRGLDLQPLPAGQATELGREQARKLAPTKRERDLLRLRGEVTDPEVLKDLDRGIAAERKRADDAARGQEYLRLADEADDPELRAGFEAKAKKLGAVRRDEPIPQPEVTELAVETIEPVGQTPNFDPRPEQLAEWKARNKFGGLDAQTAQDVDAALKYDAAAVERAGQQLERSPEAFRREIARIIEEGKARESQAKPPDRGSEGTAGDQGGKRPPGDGGEGPDGGAPVTPSRNGPRAPDGPGGGGSQARADAEGVDPGPAARAQQAARVAFDKDTEPTGNPLTDRLSAKLRTDYEGAVREYGTLEDSRGGVVLNTDTARELSPDYLADRTRSADVHEPASAFIKRVYADRLAAPTPEGKQRLVMFTAGGTGAGKTTGQGALGDAIGAPELVFDTNMNGTTSAVKKIEQALQAGRDAKILYTYADPVEAFKQAIGRTENQKKKFGSGRTVPISEHIKTHVGSSRTIREVEDRYRTDLRVNFYFVDNSRGKGNAARVQTLADLPLVSDNGLRGQLEAIAREAHRSGRIDAATLAGYLGEPSAAVRVEGLERRVPAAVQREGAGGQPRADRQGQEGRLEAPAPGPQIKGPAGSTTSVVTERGMRVPVRYRLVNVAELVTSHTDDLKVNPAFPKEFQPRDRARVSSEAQITRIQNALQPELLAESPKASDGAPILGLGDGLVLSGNARTIALRRAYAGGQANAYRAWLEQNAERFGLTAEQVRSLDRPVLVREATVEIDRADFARQANESPVAAMSDGEQAFTDAPRLPDLETLVTNDDGTINALRSATFIREFMHLVASPAERGQLMTADGRPAQRLLTRIRNAVFARAYGDAELVARMAETTDGNTRNLMGGLLRAAGDVAKLRELADAGARQPVEFVPDLIEAARRYTALRQDGMTVAQGLAQGDMLGGTASPRVAELMQEIEVNARAQRRIAEMVQRLARGVDSQGDPRQAGLGLEDE